MLVTNDSLVWGRHFDETASPEDAGSKLLKRNLSDIASMGGIPRYAVIALFCGGDVSQAWLQRFYSGLSQSAQLYHCEINGGDITQADDQTFAATLTLIGESDHPTPRRGGQAGSSIWVTGALGGSIDRHHLTFVPRLAEGAYLGKNPDTLALMDITDGLGRDLPKMIPTGLQAQIDLQAIPVSKSAIHRSKSSFHSPTWHSLYDGEDYELLLMTSPQVDDEVFLERWHKEFSTPLTRIGALRATPEPTGGHLAPVVDLTNSPLLSEEGFEHFKVQNDD